MLHPDPLSMTIAIIGLLIFVRLYFKHKKNLARPWLNTNEVFVLIAKVNPYDFEGNRVFDNRLEAIRYRDSLPNGDDFKIEPIETAIDKLKKSYFDKGFDGLKS